MRLDSTVILKIHGNFGLSSKDPYKYTELLCIIPQILNRKKLINKDMDSKDPLYHKGVLGMF